MSTWIGAQARVPDLFNPADCRLALARTSPVPLWSQIAEFIAEAITTGRLTPGQRVGSEMELADRFRVARVTIRRALTELDGRGLITRSKSRGTLVGPCPTP